MGVIEPFRLARSEKAIDKHHEKFDFIYKTKAVERLQMAITECNAISAKMVAKCSVSKKFTKSYIPGLVTERYVLSSLCPI